MTAPKVSNHSNDPTPGEQHLAYLNRLVENFIAQHPQSLQAFSRATKVLPGGTTRAVLQTDPFPVFFSRGDGTYLTSVDGHRYLDFVADMSAGLYGHTHRVLQDAVSSVVANGFSLGGVVEKEAELGEALQRRFPSLQLLRFCNSGTEANMLALATALTYTGRRRILVFDNGYHGGTLSFQTRDNPLNLPHEFVFAEYDNISATREALNDTIAAVLVEPMMNAGGMRVASKEFLHFLRRATSEFGSVLIFDEVVTSRLHYHGLQGYYDIKPDMTTLGKYLGGGLPFGAFGGNSDIMKQFDLGGPLHHSGTFNNNAYTMSAAVAATTIVTPDNLELMNSLGDQLRKRLNVMSEQSRVPGLSFVGMGSAIGMRFHGDPSLAKWIRDALWFFALEKGILIGRRGFLFFNLVHTVEHADAFEAVFAEFLQECPSFE
jgi:glutamate-1-semialdehyde 2,1-aminomutase